jgi:hypothetical protein
VLGAQHPGLERGDERIPTDLNQPGRAGSFLIARGRSRAYQVSDELFEAVMDKHG